jgi:hypothetical protein
MKEDVSWSRSAQKYLQLYVAAIASRRERRGLTTVVPTATPAGE